MTKIFSILNHKGGTAKTTTTLNLGRGLALLNKRVLVIDLDAQSNLSQSVGIDSDDLTIVQVFEHKVSKLPVFEIAERFFVTPSSLDLSVAEASLYANVNNYFTLKTVIDAVAQDYDFILIDCPPSLGIYTQNALIASNGVIIPVQAQFLSIKGLTTIIDLIEMVQAKLNPQIEVRGLVVTQTNHTKLCREIITTLRAKYSNRVFETTIRQNVAIAESSLHRKDVFSYAPESMGAEDYLKLVNEILL